MNVQEIRAEEKWVDSAEMAQHLGISKSQLRNLVKGHEAEMGVMFVGNGEQRRVCRFKVSRVEEFLRRRAA